MSCHTTACHATSRHVQSNSDASVNLDARGPPGVPAALAKYCGLVFQHGDSADVYFDVEINSFANLLPQR